jgi:hypothetical protein
MITELQRTCLSCGNEFSGGLKFCPVCMLRMGLEGQVESSEASPEDLRGTNERKPGRNATGGSTIIIERLRYSCQIVSGDGATFLGSYLRLQRGFTSRSTA